MESCRICMLTESGEWTKDNEWRFWILEKAYWRTMLESYDVEWEPTITF